MAATSNPSPPTAHPKPGDGHAARMVDKGAWPETDETEFEKHAAELRARAASLVSARDGWESGKATIFNGPTVWRSRAADAASDKVQDHSDEMGARLRQLQLAIQSCANAVTHITDAKTEITGNVNFGMWLIDAVQKEADKNKEDASKIIGDIVEKVYGVNQKVISDKAKLLGWGDNPQDGPGDKSDIRHQQDRPVPSGNTRGESSRLLGAKRSADGARTQPAASADPSALHTVHAVSTDTATSARAGGGPEAVDGPQFVAPTQTTSTSTATEARAGKGPEAVAPPLKAAQNPVQAVKPPATGGPPPVLGNPVGPPGPSTGGGMAGAPSAPSPLSSGSSGPSGLEQAANASQAAGQGPAGQAPVNPLQEFAKGFSDSANTPVHAASSGGAPPLAPSPAVPASDAMAPASTSAPLSQAGAPASAAPVQAPSSGGSMGGAAMPRRS